MKLWVKILIGLFLGVIVGIILQENAVALRPIGTLFLNMVNMIIVLMILSSMIVGITSIHDPARLGKLGIKTVLVYVTTTLIAISIALIFAKLTSFGKALSLSQSMLLSEEPLSIGQILISIVPSNPIAAMAKGEILQVIVFAVFLGIAINLSKEKGKCLLDFFRSLSDVMYRFTTLVMSFSPIGVFALTAVVVGTFGLKLIFPLIKFLGAYYFACGVHFFLCYGSLLRIFSGLKLIPFFKGMTDAIVIAFSTCSSVATLPVALHCAQENLGASKSISNFVLPLGLTMNMNGGAIYQAMGALFIADAYGIVLPFQGYVTLVLMTIFSAIGTAGIPGGGFIMLSAVLTSVGLPLEGLALLAGIDRLRDMMTTVLNILGDAAVTVFIAKSEKELDEKKYYDNQIAEFEDV